MGGRRRRAANPFSLFSFQDIITSVTAIMILVVLMLTVELIGRSRNAGVAPEHRRTAAELKAAIAELERTAADLRQDVERLQAANDRLASWSAADLGRALRELRTRQDRLEAELLEARAAAAAADAERRDAERSLATQEGRAADVERMAAELADVRARLRRQEAENADRARQASAPQRDERERPVLVFNRAPGDERRPRLAEVSDRGVVVSPQQGTQARALGWGLLGPPSSFTRWLGTLDRATESVVIILRPSGVDRYDPVRQAVIDAGIDVGTELAAEDAPVALAADGEPR